MFQFTHKAMEMAFSTTANREIELICGDLEEILEQIDSMLDCAFRGTYASSQSFVLSEDEYAEDIISALENAGFHVTFDDTILTVSWETSSEELTRYIEEDFPF